MPLDPVRFLADLLRILWPFQGPKGPGPRVTTNPLSFQDSKDFFLLLLLLLILLLFWIFPSGYFASLSWRRIVYGEGRNSLKLADPCWSRAPIGPLSIQDFFFSSLWIFSSFVVAVALSSAAHYLRILQDFFPGAFACIFCDCFRIQDLLEDVVDAAAYACPDPVHPLRSLTLTPTNPWPVEDPFRLHSGFFRGSFEGSLTFGYLLFPAKYALILVATVDLFLLNPCGIFFWRGKFPGDFLVDFLLLGKFVLLACVCYVCV